MYGKHTYPKFKHEKRISDLPSTMSLALPIFHYISLSIAFRSVVYCITLKEDCNLYLRLLLIAPVSWAKIHRENQYSHVK